ncbi:MAG: hypothetical protein RL757_1065 [Bacteroidota bacterium]|jgi:hypothetical protein
MWKKYRKNIGIGLLAAFVLAQLIRPAKNISGDDTKHLRHTFAVSPEIEGILQKNCYDCHSNKTVYPWYSAVQPVASWLAHHVEEGKGEINFSVFSDYKLRRQFHKLEEIVEQLEHNEMPSPSYTWMHGNISEADKKTLIAWSKSTMDTLKAHYPIDSLVRKKQ